MNEEKSKAQEFLTELAAASSKKVDMSSVEDIDVGGVVQFKDGREKDFVGVILGKRNNLFDVKTGTENHVGVDAKRLWKLEKA